MDNEINIGDEFFTTLAFAGTNLTPSKNYVCTGIGGDKGAAYKVYFIDDEGNEDWHFNNVFNKAKKATPQEEDIMDNEIKKGDTFFIGMETSTINLTPLKSYVCTDVENDEDGLSYAIHFIDDNGEKDWHLSSMFTKTKEATPTPVVKPHKWADVIHQWADGAEVEIKSIDGWVSIINPEFLSGCTYRVKPSAEDIQQETNKKIQQEVDKQYAKMTVAFNEYMAVSKSGQEYINNLKLGIK